MSNKRYIEYYLDSSHILIQNICTSQVLFCLKAEPEMGIPQASSSLKGNNSQLAGFGICGPKFVSLLPHCMLLGK